MSFDKLIIAIIFLSACAYLLKKGRQHFSPTDKNGGCNHCAHNKQQPLK